ncbi:hypothetical protein UVI_02043080 [Ustilaginoidea virens]|uniref:Uncharacterized protein n=1 Tax=Ustilaginoidea virens TaxID=1159556 RepID=A0A1B5L042_USTVR|nr:hypothetical protein UVI_02043080 [Ustilaginoidea virens]
MAGFLASFNFGDREESFAPQDDGCPSLDQLQKRLQQIIDEKTTETRAQRVTATLDVAGTAQFPITAAIAPATIAPEQDDGASNVDPRLSEAEPMHVDSENRGSDQTLVYTAAEVLRNQLDDAAAVQRAVAEQIVETASHADGSTWVLHKSDLTPNGGTYVFLCARSVRQWTIEHPETTKLIVGDYTKKDPDPLLMTLHKTVGELGEFRKPPPMIGPQKPDKTTLALAVKEAQRVAAQARKLANKENRPKKIKTPRPRKKKANTGSDVQTQTQAQLSLADQASQALEGAGMIQLQEAVAREQEEEGGTALSETQTQARPVVKELALNVSPEEAARRRDVALKLLTDAGVGHASLTPDQFNIFANQAPDLQKESLNMIIAYGAERLQIVHPSHRESSTSVPPSGTHAQTAGDGSASALPEAQATTKKQLVLDETPKAKGRSRPLGKSRLACFQCKNRKVRAGNISCEYPPQKPRKKKTKTDAPAADDVVNADGDDGGDGDGTPDETLMTEAHEENTQVEQFAEPRSEEDFQRYGDGYYSYPQVPADADAGQDVIQDAQDAVQDEVQRAGQVEAPSEPNQNEQEHQPPPTSLPYFQTPSGFSLPQPDPLDDPPRPLLHSSLALPDSTVYFPPYQPATATPAQQEAPPAHDSQSQGRDHHAAQPHAPSSHGNHARQTPNAVGKSDSGSRDGTTSSTWNQQHTYSLPPPVRSTTHLSPLSQPALAGSQSPDVATTAILNTNHGVQMQDVLLLAHATSAHNQRYTPNSGVKMHHPAAAATPKQSPQPAYVQRSESQPGRRTATPQRGLGGAYSTSPDQNADLTNNSKTMPGGRMSMGGLQAGGGYGSNVDMASEASSKIGYKPYSYHQRSSMAVNYSPYQYGPVTTEPPAAVTGTPPQSMAQGVASLRSEVQGAVNCLVED